MVDQTIVNGIAGDLLLSLFIQQNNAHIRLLCNVLRQARQLLVVQILDDDLCRGTDLIGLIYAIEALQHDYLKDPQHPDHKSHKEDQIQHDGGSHSQLCGDPLVVLFDAGTDPAVSLFQSDIPPHAAL